MLKRKQRHCKSQRWRMTQERCPPERQDWCTYELKETMIARTPPVQGSTGQKSQHWGGEVGLVTLLSQKLLQLTLPGKGKIISFLPAGCQWMDQPYPSAGLIHGNSLVNTKQILWCLRSCGCMFSYHCLFFFNFHCLLLFERDREHGVDGEDLGGLQGEERL